MAAEKLKPSEPKREAVKWYESQPGLPNDTEMLLTTLLVIKRPTARGELDEWARKVKVEKARADELWQAGKAWTPPEGPEWKGSGKGASLFEPVREAVTGKGWVQADHEAIAKAIHAWQGAGHDDRLRSDHVSNYLKRLPEGPRDAKGRTKPRWQATIPYVGDLIIRYRVELDKLLKDDTPREQMLTDLQRAEKAEAEKAELEKKMPALILERDQLRDRHRKAAGRLSGEKRSVRDAKSKLRAELQQKHKEDKAAHVTKVRERETARADRKIEKAEGRLDERIGQLDREYEERFETQRKGLNKAREEKRDAVAATKKSQRKVARLEKKVEELEAESASDEPESMSEDEETRRHLAFDVLPRRDERGRWQAEDEDVRAMRYAQLARGVAPSTVSANVTDVLALVAPHLDLAQPCERQNQLMRGEVTLAGEGMQAWKFAACKRVMSAGWDESTKFGNAVFACNFQIENFDGSIENITLRGLSILPEGGTSKKLLVHIEKRILGYARERLTRWKEEYEAQNGGEGSWAAAGGPSPENIGLHRLCEDTVLMTDTCNGARCTKRMCAPNTTRLRARSGSFSGPATGTGLSNTPGGTTHASWVCQGARSRRRAAPRSSLRRMMSS